MKKIWIIPLLILLASCQQKAAVAPPVEPLLEIDRQFSKVSAEKGWVQAFLEFADDSVVLLRPKAPPIEGRIFLMAYLLEYGDTTSQLTWEPKKGVMAVSGEMGYTYGIWTVKDSEANEMKGTYVTIWRKNNLGEWKFLLDTGNSGLSDL